MDQQYKHISEEYLLTDETDKTAIGGTKSSTAVPEYSVIYRNFEF
jgi:hypothetical protein